MANFYFTHYWSRDSCDYYISIGQEGLLLDHTAGSLFMKRGVSKNDFIYVVTIREGELFLIGKMQVGEIVFSDEEAKRCIGYEPWSAPEHLIAKSCTPMRLDRAVPLNVTRSLRFIGPEGLKPLKFESSTKLNRQTLRGVRKLKPPSAVELDKLLEE